MEYTSTRGQSKNLTFSEAVSEGLAPDGGLYVPVSIPDISKKLDSWEGLGYADLCFEFLRIFADDIPPDDLKKIVSASYTRFDDKRVAPLVKLDEKLYLLELYHGPTLAFKDFALQFVGNLYEYLLSKSGRKINVLGATSGDTGSRNQTGFSARKTSKKIFHTVSRGQSLAWQERQMTSRARKTISVSIAELFDDVRRL